MAPILSDKLRKRFARMPINETHMNQPLAEQIDAILPQTQCGKCGFPGCKPYAQAIAEGRADINQCPPGDQIGVQKIAGLLGVPPKPLNTAHGFPKPYKMVALIDESLCIGCTFCSRACPVDAIAGAVKQMHTVIAAECTGCELCIAPCPMDCIHLVPPAAENLNNADNLPAAGHNRQAADLARSRYQFRQQRLEREKQEAAGKALERKNNLPSRFESESKTAAEARKKAAIQAALARAKTIRTSHPGTHSSGKNA